MFHDVHSSGCYIDMIPPCQDRGAHNGRGSSPPDRRKGPGTLARREEGGLAQHTAKPTVPRESLRSELLLLLLPHIVLSVCLSSSSPTSVTAVATTHFHLDQYHQYLSLSSLKLQNLPSDRTIAHKRGSTQIPFRRRAESCHNLVVSLRRADQS